MEKSVERLSREVKSVAVALEKQNDLRRRLLTGLVFGIGTAIGASVIATLIIVATAKLLAPIGVDLVAELNDSRQILESQIQTQTPQN